ncbi:hypothetical protein GCM10009785_25910 [Brooklawnia cerclae]|uniref:Uncharacterized protein n=1 Tax=Brooklawnia cerclae TaxID=349934 RepID=A0ABX0SAL1_9ACTN|nr:hypothetical protein [Brooklawnia cerclae]NIH55445.1 hypothetical protein [Brooklawnia cerclae]
MREGLGAGWPLRVATGDVDPYLEATLWVLDHLDGVAVAGPVPRPDDQPQPMRPKAASTRRSLRTR